MNLKWYYDTENDGTTSPVATLYKENGCPVLQVYEGKDAYFSRSYSEYSQHINRIKVTYEVVNQFVEEEEKKRDTIFTESERKLEEVKVACALLESNFKMQVNTILSLFS